LTGRQPFSIRIRIPDGGNPSPMNPVFTKVCSAGNDGILNADF